MLQGKTFTSSFCATKTPLSIAASLARSRPSAQRSSRLHVHTVCSKNYPKLVLYTKPGCPLCDGLKSKVQGLIDRAQFQPSVLSDVDFEVRDISTDPGLVQAYDLRVPMLAREDSNGNEDLLPQFAPRMTADRLEKKLEPYFTD